MAAVTEWVFSPLSSATGSLCLFDFHPFQMMRREAKDPLCVKPCDLKAASQSGCVRIVASEMVRGKGSGGTQCTQNCLDPCFLGVFFPYDGVQKQRCLRERDWEREGEKWKKNMDDAAKFVDSLLRTVKTEQGNDKIIFFFHAELHTNIFPQTLALKSHFESETNLFIENCMRTGSNGLRPPRASTRSWCPLGRAMLPCSHSSQTSNWTIDKKMNN